MDLLVGSFVTIDNCVAIRVELFVGDGCVMKNPITFVKGWSRLISIIPFDSPFLDLD